MYSVLIVDDEKIVKLAIKSMISWGESGFELLGTASDGSKALQICEKKTPDIIITDLKMPYMDGIEFIKKLKEKNYDGEVLVLSNYNDFDLVREAMKYGAYDYILKVTVKTDDFMRVLSEMKEKLDKKRGNKSIAQSQNRSLETERYELFKNILSSNETIYDKNFLPATDMFEYGRKNCSYSFIMTCKDEDAVRKTGQVISTIIKNISGNIFNNCNWQCVVGFEKKSVFVAVHFKDSESVVLPGKIAERIQELTSMYYNLRIGVVYGSESKDIEELINEINKCRKALDIMFYSSFDEACISSDNIPSDYERDVKELADAAVDKVFCDLVIGCIDDIMKSFEGIIKAGARSQLNPYRLKKIIKKLLREVEKKLINNGICNEEILDEYSNEEDTIFAASSEDKLLDTLKQIFIVAVQKTFNKRIFRKEVCEALRYIEENICRKIFVPEIAKRVSLTDTYLCKVFKADVGKSIIDYINELKMKKAYELIESNNYLIKQAAAVVGIEDQFYFNRLFKKYFGITPKDIKRKL